MISKKGKEERRNIKVNITIRKKKKKFKACVDMNGVL